MFGFFAWIRAGVRAAVLSGLNDAAEQLGESFDPAEAQQRLRQRLQPLPAPPAESAEANGHAEASASGRGRRKGSE